jgi:N6-L-threonylcarbamoyladenine synthase
MDTINKMGKSMRVLGIETSCDETAAAIVEDGQRILSSVVASQIDVHHIYGGVVPELASRMHLESVVPVVEAAISDAGLDRDELDGVAVTRGPGLVGALLVGFCFAKAFAYACGLPCAGVDHLEGHLHSVLLSNDPPPFPYVALLASGGHTGIYHITSIHEYRLLGQTRDDAAGEAYDKVAKMLGLGYPGGAVIDELAFQGDPGKIHFSRPFVDKDSFDFSFSGIKTAVSRHLQTYPSAGRMDNQDIAAGFQAAVLDVLIHKLLNAARKTGCRHVAVVGGVAANRGLRQRLMDEAGRLDIDVHIPPMSLCGDNAAMIAATGYHYLNRQHTIDLETDVYSRSTRPQS